MRQPGRQFAYTLALALGAPNVDAMLRGLTSAQLAEWEAYYQLQPFGKHAEDARTGIVASVVANASGNFKKKFVPSDFMPKSEEEREADQSRRGAASLMDPLRRMGAKQKQPVNPRSAAGAKKARR